MIRGKLRGGRNTYGFARHSPTHFHFPLFGQQKLFFKKLANGPNFGVCRRSVVAGTVVPSATIGRFASGPNNPFIFLKGPLAFLHLHGIQAKCLLSDHVGHWLGGHLPAGGQWTFHPLRPAGR